MPAEYRLPNGGLAQGYYCSNCGQSCNMVATGHHDGKCVSNPKYVTALNEENKPEGLLKYLKPGYIMPREYFDIPETDGVPWEPIKKNVNFT